MKIERIEWGFYPKEWELFKVSRWAALVWVEFGPFMLTLHLKDKSKD